MHLDLVNNIVCLLISLRFRVGELNGMALSVISGVTFFT